MKKSLLFLGLFLSLLSIDNRAYASKLNEHELSIIEAASEIYEYNGKNYKADQKYIDKLTNYLLQDHIDINADDKEQIIQLAYANIELGIKDGYLKPIDISQGEDVDSGTEVDEQETVKEILESLGKEMSDIESYIPSLVSENENKSNEIEVIDSINEIRNSEYDKTEDKKTEEKENEISNSKDNNTISNNTEEKNTLEEEIIKQTGFNLNTSFYIIMGIGILMILAIIVAIKNNYFTNAYE